MQENHLNEICNAAKNGELALILGSKLTNENPWQEWLNTIFSHLIEQFPELQNDIREIRERDLTIEAFVRILYRHIGDSMQEAFAGFLNQSPNTIHYKIVELIRQKACSYLGVAAVDSRLRLALQSQKLEVGRDYLEAENLESKLPVIEWLNGEIENLSSMQSIFQVLPSQWNGLSKKANQFAKKIKKGIVLVIGAFPGEFFWRSIYAALLELAKKNIPVYWVSKQELIPLTHLTSICNTNFLKISPEEAIDAILSEHPAVVLEEKAWEKNWGYLQEWTQKHKDHWVYILAVLLNHLTSRSHALMLFEQLLVDYQKEKNYAMTASCYRWIGKIFYEQGFLERSIEQHVKAIAAWASAQDSVATAEEYVLCGDNYWNGSALEKASQYYGEALSLYRQLRYAQGTAEVTSKLALLCETEEDYELAKQYYVESLEARRILQDHTGEILTLINLSNSLIKMQAWEEAQKYLEMTIELAKNHQDTIALGDAYQLMGLIYLTAQEYAKARKYYEDAHALYQDEKDELSSTFVYCHLGHVCARLEDYPNAIKYYESSLEYYEKIGDWQHLAAVYTNLGLIHSNYKEYRLAEDYFAKSEEIFAALGDVYNLIRTHTNLAKVYTLQSQIPNAIECYRANIEMLIQLGDKEDLAANLVALAMAYLQNKELNETVEHLQRAFSIYDSLGMEEEKQETAQILDAIEAKRKNPPTP